MGSQGIPNLEFKDKFYNSIDGQLKTTKTTQRGINPGTEKPNPEVPVATIQDVDDAVGAARSAFKTWSKQSYAERRDTIHRFADAVESYQEGFAGLLNQEQGKPVSFALCQGPHSTRPLGTACSFEYLVNTWSETEFSADPVC
jgi:hypothetical protein